MGQMMMMMMMIQEGCQTNTHTHTHTQITFGAAPAAASLGSLDAAAASPSVADAAGRVAEAAALLAPLCFSRAASTWFRVHGSRFTKHRDGFGFRHTQALPVLFWVATWHQH